MYLGSMPKQPGEKLPVDIDYSRVIGCEVTASSIALTVTAPSGMALDATTTSAADKRGQLWISGGTDGNSYSWTVVADIVIGGRTVRVEDEFLVEVAEVTATNGAQCGGGWLAVM